MNDLVKLENYITISPHIQSPHILILYTNTTAHIKKEGFLFVL